MSNPPQIISIISINLPNPQKSSINLGKRTSKKHCQNYLVTSPDVPPPTNNKKFTSIIKYESKYVKTIQNDSKITERLTQHYYCSSPIPQIATPRAFLAVVGGATCNICNAGKQVIQTCFPLIPIFLYVLSLPPNLYLASPPTIHTVHIPMPPLPHPWCHRDQLMKEQQGSCRQQQVPGSTNKLQKISSRLIMNYLKGPHHVQPPPNNFYNFYKPSKSSKILHQSWKKNKQKTLPELFSDFS